MDYVSEAADVVVGDLVVTSGIDGIFPEGFTSSGTSTPSRRAAPAYKRITVKPAVDFRALEEVLVVLTPPAREPAAGSPQRVKAAGVILAVAAALALQTTLARFVVRGTVAVDLVLVVVVYVALTSGPVTGLLSGHFAGLVQDALSSGVIGIGGLAKTIVGFLAGIIGTQFIVAQPLPRFVVFFGATVLHAAGVHRVVRAARFAAVRDAVRRGRRAGGWATRWSAWWRSSWSSCCLERSSGGGPQGPVPPVRMRLKRSWPLKIGEGQRFG